MAISIACECGKKLAVKEEMAGRKVKCPACGTVLTVPALGDEVPARQHAEAAEVEDAGGDEAPVRKKKAKAGGGKKNNKMMWIIGGIAGALLLGCGCCGVGVGGWFFFLRGGPEKTIIGKWGFDLEATKKNNPSTFERPQGIPEKQWEQIQELQTKMMSKMSFEIKSDGTLSAAEGDKTDKSKVIKWRVAEKKGDTLTLETKEEGGTKDWEKTVEITVIDSNHLKFTPLDRGSKISGDKDRSLYMKRL